MSTYKINPTKLKGKIKLSFSGTGTIEIVEDSSLTHFVSVYKREVRS
jgi:hypothetical protein